MAVLPLVLMLIVSLTPSEATDFLVGGKENSWQVPSSPSEFNRWAQKNRFKVGDYLVWKEDAKSDWVLEVTRQGYETCNTSNPVRSYSDGSTRVKLDRSGPFFFISGVKGHCEKGQKLEVVVLSEDHHRKSEAPSPAPANSTAPTPAHSGGNALLRDDVMIVVGLFIKGFMLGHLF
ncbi:hypothetical protein CRG98_009415 [Punica granatum]|nr:hypothetical protein CRG98_009415 [Punica granatum]